jgi:pectin methylesterase-like acyl-CoA thioesterase
MHDYTKFVGSMIIGAVLYASTTAVLNREKDTYTIPASCTNCQYHGDVKVVLGTEVTGATCPHCGTKKLNSNFWDKIQSKVEQKEEPKK